MGTRRSFLKLIGKVGLIAGIGSVAPTVLMAKEKKLKRKIPSSPASIPSRYWDFEKGEAKIDDLVKDLNPSKIKN